MSESSWTRVLFEAIDDAVFVHDDQGNILDANPAACRRLGYSLEELLRLNTRDIDAPEFAQGFQSRLRSQLQTGGMRCEGVHRTKDGRHIIVDINTSAITRDGNPAVLAVMRDITQRKLTEDALSKQRQLLQSILDNMSDAIVVADAAGDIVLHNPMAEHVFGAGLLEERFDLYYADRITRLEEFPLHRCVRGESFDGAEYFVKHEGAPAGLWISVSGRPLRERDGTLKGGVLVCSDISEHKRFEDALRDSRALYEALVEGLPQHIFCKDRESRLTFGNQRYCADLNRPLSEILGKTDRDFFPEELASKYIADDQRVMDTRQNVDTIEEHIKPDGSRIYVHVVKTPIFNAQNEVIGVQGIFWDVTQEVLANKAVTSSEKRYRQLTEATMDGIVVIDPDGNIALFNPAAERMFGYLAQEVLGEPARRLIPDEFKNLQGDGVADYLQRRLPEILGQPQEFVGKRKDGSDFPAEIVLSLLTESADHERPDAHPAQILCAIRDLTERNKMRAFLQQNEKLASIGLLSAGVAHEINNPLAFVANNMVVLERDCKGLLEILAMYASANGSLSPDFASRIQAMSDEIDLPYIRDNLGRILERTRDGVERVTKIVHSLRGMARTEAPRRQDTKIPDLINSSLDILGKYKRLGVHVEQSHDANPIISCVPTQISQVILNLLVNSYQAIEATGRKDGRIHITTQRRAGHLVLEVRDNGCGIKPEIFPRLFDPFFTTKDVGEGTGLGLSISHHIIAAHGGKIEVESKVGEGACFRVYLPLTNSK